MAFPRINVDRALLEGSGTFPYVTSSAAGNSPFGRQLSVAAAWQARSALRYVPGDPPPITNYVVDNAGSVLTNRRVRDPLVAAEDEFGTDLNNQSWMFPSEDEPLTPPNVPVSAGTGQGATGMQPVPPPENSSSDLPSQPEMEAMEPQAGDGGGVSTMALHQCRPRYNIDGSIEAFCETTSGSRGGPGQLLFPNAAACEDSCTSNLFPRLGENLTPLTPVFFMNIQQPDCRDCRQDNQPLSGRCWVLPLRPRLATEGLPTVQPGLGCLQQGSEGADQGLPVEFHLVPTRLGSAGQNFFISPPAQPEVANGQPYLVRNGERVQVVSRRHGTMVVLGTRQGEQGANTGRGQAQGGSQIQMGFSQESFAGQGNSLIWEFVVEAATNQEDIIKVGDAIRLRPVGTPGWQVSGLQGRGSPLIASPSQQASAFRMLPRTSLSPEIRQRLEALGSPTVRPSARRDGAIVPAGEAATPTEDNRVSWIVIVVIVTAIIIVILLGIFLFFWFRPDKKKKEEEGAEAGYPGGGEAMGFEEGQARQGTGPQPGQQPTF